MQETQWIKQGLRGMPESLQQRFQGYFGRARTLGVATHAVDDHQQCRMLGHGHRNPILVFLPATGQFVIPDLLGGTRTLMIGKVLWDEFFTNSDWPLASAVAICLLVLLVGPIALFQRQHSKSLERAE